MRAGLKFRSTALSGRCVATFILETPSRIGTPWASLRSIGFSLTIASVWDVTTVQGCALPEEALTQRYRASGAYTDCFFTELARPVTHAEFVEAFYTTGLFKLERWILRLCVARPSSDAEARALARGERDSFAAWSVEARAPGQVLLRDFTGRTCSWLMVANAERRRAAGFISGPWSFPYSTPPPESRASAPFTASCWDSTRSIRACCCGRLRAGSADDDARISARSTPPHRRPLRCLLLSARPTSGMRDTWLSTPRAGATIRMVRLAAFRPGRPARFPGGRTARRRRTTRPCRKPRSRGARRNVCGRRPCRRAGTR